MATPSCVIDATTLVENIHEIKSWFYHGEIQLVVPSSTFERIEKLSQEYKEQNLKKPDPPRQKRASWKPARKEFPMFDINLQVAEEFLIRQKVQGDLQNHIIFQQSSEEYSLWKGVEAAEEKKDSKQDGPTTWAQAALTSLQHKSTSSTTVDTPRGTLKPKLVARSTRTETSPWKTNKNAPKMLPAEVSESLRPLLSYALWRIYENVITRADTQASIILSDNKETCDTARKLNIGALCTKELRDIIRSQKPAVDLKLFGDLERDFGVRKSADLPSQSGDTHAVPTEKALLYRDDATIMEDKSSDTNQLNDFYGTNLTEISILPNTNEDNDREKVSMYPGENIMHNEIVGPSRVNVEQQQVQPDSCESPSSMEAIASSTSSEKSLSVLTEQHSLPTGEDKLWISVDEPGILTKHVNGLPGPDLIPMLEPQLFNEEHNNDYHQNPEPECLTEKADSIHKQESGPFTHGVNALALVEPELVSGAAPANSERPRSDFFDKKAHGLQKTKPDALTKRFNPAFWQEPEHHIKHDNDLHRRRPKKANNSRDHSTRHLLQINLDAAPEINNIAIPSVGIDDITAIDSNSSGKVGISKEIQTSQLPLRSQHHRPPRNSNPNNKAKPTLNRSPNTQSTVPAQVASVQIAPGQVPPAHFPPAQDASDPYDSDEEVVVFSPKTKRLSAQKTPPKQINSRPPTRGNHVHASPQAKAPLIDPDAFGRSDAIGPPHVVNSRTQAQNWQYPRYPPRGNPRHVSRTNEQEVDFVLKSGSPRGTSRGQGKLWVP